MPISATPRSERLWRGCILVSDNSQIADFIGSRVGTETDRWLFGLVTAEGLSTLGVLAALLTLVFAGAMVLKKSMLVIPCSGKR